MPVSRRVGQVTLQLLAPHLLHKLNGICPRHQFYALPIMGRGLPELLIIACGPPQDDRPSRALAGVEGLEPPTPGFGDRCSSQLSYTPAARRLPINGPPAFGPI